ncbi:MAG: GTP 3',8-cyclase MoaA [Telmatospirillum sp.]|nr:GTP 3',8-cyclase MoaA [Telmatospirillum sp.]MDR3439111.1 GTP 3',8-cyclase MoaA [Telmatospirillum sp.]
MTENYSRDDAVEKGDLGFAFGSGQSDDISAPAPTHFRGAGSILVDAFGRRISSLRLSVTDRCDLRCFYCMAKTVSFQPRSEVLSLQELCQVAEVFINLGVRNLRLTGGEPLVRRGVLWLVERLGEQIGQGKLDELTLTTNATRLKDEAAALWAAGVRRINVSLDTLDPETFHRITGHGDLHGVLDGIAAAQERGFAIKINTVALKGVNDHEFDALIAWCGRQGADMTLIETMPLGDIATSGRDFYLPLNEARDRIGQRWELLPSEFRTSGPSDYVTVAETGRRLGFITPLSHRFCGACNRVRVTCTGKLYMCLGRDDGVVDLRGPLRAAGDPTVLEDIVRTAIAGKPEGHKFGAGGGRAEGALARRMNVTGG